MRNLKQQRQEAELLVVCKEVPQRHIEVIQLLDKMWDCYVVGDKYCTQAPDTRHLDLEAKHFMQEMLMDVHAVLSEA